MQSTAPGISGGLRREIEIGIVRSFLHQLHESDLEDQWYAEMKLSIEYPLPAKIPVLGLGN
jgi:hypothetical protein